MTISTDIFIPPIVPERTKSVRLQFEFDDEENELTTDEFWNFCAQNDKLQIELIKKNELKVTFPKGWQYSRSAVELMGQMYDWQKKYQTGEFFNHLIGYLLPNGLILSPSFSWTQQKRFDGLSKEQKEKLIHLCPDFVVEMTSPSDSLSKTQEKMLEYIENGTQLGWLIHSKTKQIFVYRPNAEVEILENPTKVSGEPLLKGFELDLTEIW
jgi:Uma2 family endonuclease